VRRPSSTTLDPHDLRVGDDGVHPKIEVAVREVVVHQLDVEPDADPCRIRPGLREEPVVEPPAVADPSPGSVDVT